MMKDEVLTALAEKYGTPLYAYDEKAIRGKFRTMAMFPYQPSEVYFASMCNNNPHIIRIAHEEGLKLFVNSRKHMMIGYAIGMQPDEIS